MTLRSYDKHGTAFQNSIILESVPGTASDRRTVPGHNACLPGKAMHSTKQPAHQSRSEGSKLKSILQAIPLFNCNPAGSPRNQRFASQSCYTSLQTKVDISMRAQDKPRVSVGLQTVKLPLTFILNTT